MNEIQSDVPFRERGREMLLSLPSNARPDVAATWRCDCASNFRTRHLHITKEGVEDRNGREHPIGCGPEIPLILQTWVLARQYIKIQKHFSLLLEQRLGEHSNRDRFTVHHLDFLNYAQIWLPTPGSFIGEFRALAVHISFEARQGNQCQIFREPLACACSISTLLSN